MLDRSKKTKAYLDRVIYRQYQNAQRKRWISENSSEGIVWSRLNPKYAESKKKRFAAYPGQGTKMLIATGQLQSDVIGGGSGHRKIVTDDSIAINWTTPYAVAVDSVRTFSTFGEKTMDEMYSGIAKFIMVGELRGLGL